MPSLIGNMLATYGHPMQEFACGVSVQIRRGSLTGSPITAIVDVVENKVVGSVPNTSVIIESRNYEIAASAYKVNGVPVEPQDSDEILETVNGVECVFELMRFGKDLAAFQRLESDGLKWLVRTKQVAANA